jgi:penicillin-binding protein-related factor A (putative recombinase)
MSGTIDPALADLMEYEIPDEARGRKSSIGQRGKSAESKVQDRLKALCVSADKAFYRLPDFRAGSMQPTLADFLFFHKGITNVIEVKEVNHEYRLPYKNFDTGQIARMRTLQLAGANCIVLVYFTPTGLWRGFNLEWFINTPRTTKSGSWDMSQFKLQPLEELL